MSVDKFGCFLNEKEYSRDITKGLEKFQSILNDYDGHLNVQRKRFKNSLPPIHENDIATKIYIDDEISKLVQNTSNEISKQPQKQQIFRLRPRINNIEGKVSEISKKLEFLMKTFNKVVEDINEIESNIFNYIIAPTSVLKGETESLEKKPFIPDKLKL